MGGEGARRFDLESFLMRPRRAHQDVAGPEKCREGRLVDRMSQEEEITKAEATETDRKPSKNETTTVNRREFLKLAAAAGATVGLSTGLGGLVAACGGETSTTAAPTSTTAAPGSSTTAAPGSSTTAPASSTSTSAVESGAEIKIGFITPLTGGLASFGVPDNYCVSRWKEFAADGVIGGDGKKHAISISVSDSQSDSNRAAQVAGDLINNTGVDIMLVASTPDTTAPVADICEASGVPCLSTDTPWQSFIATRSGGDLTKVFTWTYHVFWGLEDVQANFLDIWSKVPNNKVVASMFPNDADGNAWRPGWEPVWSPAGLKDVDPGPFQNGTEDFTSQISLFKSNGCEIGMGVFIPPDFTNFWKQSIQQGWVPKCATYAKALLFPQSVEALGSIANGLTTEVWWTPTHPFTSSLTGETCGEIASDFEAKTGQQWTQPLLHYICFEMAVDCIKRATDPKDKTAIIDAAKTMNFESLGGPIDFAAPIEPAGPPWKVGPCHIVENVYKSPLVGGQWVIGTNYPFELVVVVNDAGTMVPIGATVQPYTIT